MTVEQNSCTNFKRNKNYKKKFLNFSILGQIQEGSGSGSGILKTGSGAKLSGSSTLPRSIMNRFEKFTCGALFQSPSGQNKSIISPAVQFYQL